MKIKILLLFFVFITMIVKGQFSAPTNFSYNYSYIMLGEGDFCGDTFLIGPTYCSHIMFSAPDTNLTTATLINYKLYYRHNYLPNDTDIFILNETNTYMELGVIGCLWLTAVYRNPDGESLKTDSICNDDLPIGIKDLNHENEVPLLTMNPYNKKLLINKYKEIKTISIYSKIGICLKVFQNVYNELSVQDLNPDLYFLKILYKDNNISTQKILINRVL